MRTEKPYKFADSFTAQRSGPGRMMLATLGVVSGDIGTNPLYAVRECFHGKYGIAANQNNVLGVLSLMIWALILIVTLKDLVFVLRADNQGEGGVMALTALIRQRLMNSDYRRRGLPPQRVIEVGIQLRL